MLVAVISEFLLDSVTVRKMDPWGMEVRGGQEHSGLSKIMQLAKNQGIEWIQNSVENNSIDGKHVVGIKSSESNLISENVTRNGTIDIIEMVKELKLLKEEEQLVRKEILKCKFNSLVPMLHKNSADQMETNLQILINYFEFLLDHENEFQVGIRSNLKQDEAEKEFMILHPHQHRYCLVLFN